MLDRQKDRFADDQRRQEWPRRHFQVVHPSVVAVLADYTELDRLGAALPLPVRRQWPSSNSAHDLVPATFR